MTKLDKQKEIDFFKKFGDKDYDVFTELGYKRLLKEFDKLNPCPGDHCVDFGCGTGAFTNRLKHYGLRLTGIDISPEQIEFANKNYADKTTEFIVGDIECTDYPDNSVDIVIFSGVLHHFDDFNRTVAEAYRILKPSGRVYAYDPNKHNPVMWLYRDPKSPFCSKKGRTDNERLLTEREIRDVFTMTGFRSISVYSVSNVPFKYVESKAGKLILPLYNCFEFCWEYVPVIRRKAGSFLITLAEK